MNKVTLLWSGGWDGTFRFLELMQHEDIEIQPIYVIDPGRESTPYEKKAMKKIYFRSFQKISSKSKRYSIL